MQNFKSLLLILLSLYSGSVLANDDDHWDNQFGAPGAEGQVTRILCHGSDVYVTGNFTSAGEAASIGIAKWDGANWSGFGSGFSLASYPVGYAVAVHGSDVYAGGIFITNIDGVAVRNLGKWNGSGWSEVGGGINGAVAGLLFKGNDLYVCGIFTNAGSVAASNIVRWDGTNWYALGKGLYGATNGFTGALAWTMALDANSDLIVGGNFRYAGDVEANNVARWDGSQWHALDNGVLNGGSGLRVNDLAVRGSNVYVAGVFTSASGVNATNVARWDGTQWHGMDAGPGATNFALAFVGTNLYTAGNFTNIGGVAARYVARWNGSVWEALAPGQAGGTLSPISCLASDGTNLYVGGDFIQAGNAGALAVAKWDGVQWSALAGPKSQGLWLAPVAITAVGDELYVGGSGLRIAGGIKPYGIAHWNGNAWDDMAGGITGGSGRVNTIVEYGGNIYVGGNFTNAGGVAANNIAWWDGANWHAMASGLNNSINALCIHNGQLFAGGAFTARGDGSGTLPGIARWNGDDWVDVPSISSYRIDNVVNTLVSDGVNLYIGGNYYIGWFYPSPPYTGADVDNVGYWDGTNWWPLGNGLDNTVNSLALVGSDLYAGGSFAKSGSTPIHRIAKWDGTSWSEAGGGIANGTVSELASDGSALYVGGSYTNAGGIIGMSRFVKWDGSQWQMLGSGVSRISPTSCSVSGIAISGNDVYLVGSFTHAGGRPSAAIAHWNETKSFVPPIIQLIHPGINGLGQFHFDIAGLSSGTFSVQAATNLTNWSDIYSDSVPNTNFTDPDSSGTPARVYRVKTTWP